MKGHALRTIKKTAIALAILGLCGGTFALSIFAGIYTTATYMATHEKTKYKGF